MAKVNYVALPYGSLLEQFIAQVVSNEQLKAGPDLSNLDVTVTINDVECDFEEAFRVLDARFAEQRRFLDAVAALRASDESDWQDGGGCGV